MYHYIRNIVIEIKEYQLAMKNLDFIEKSVDIDK